uniref:Probable DNA polymerase n=1 Tax=Fomitiporia mediterranea TaxID=208960 RepID=A0A5B9RKB0_9AGAM|nr:DNA polymerase family B [Fomitiporia mediterranea]QEG57107.1 DNA polymerase family B [Fomitiporia mediterranea]
MILWFYKILMLVSILHIDTFKKISFFAYDKNFVSKASKAKNFSFINLTLEVETYKDVNGKLNIYCISFYEGKLSKSFYLSDFPSIKELIKALLENIFTKIYSGKDIYIHNSSNFDLIFLYKYIVNFTDVKVNPIIKDGKFINLEVKYGPNGNLYNINFKDSLLLLQISLDKLSKAFNVENKKDIFPHDFVSKDNLNYIGPVPSIDYFKNLPLDKYNEYKSRFNNNWSLKEEAIKYCELDCIALYQVLMNFSNEFFKEFSVNISTTPTLPSAAFKVYRTSFIPENVKIQAIGGTLFEDIKKGYYGGHVDMFVPKNFSGELVHHYDVNSLYPHVMKSYVYPTKCVAHFQ